MLYYEEDLATPEEMLEFGYDEAIETGAFVAPVDTPVPDEFLSYSQKYFLPDQRPLVHIYVQQVLKEGTSAVLHLCNRAGDLGDENSSNVVDEVFLSVHTEFQEISLVRGAISLEKALRIEMGYYGKPDIPGYLRRLADKLEAED